MRQGEVARFGRHWILDSLMWSREEEVFMNIMVMKRKSMLEVYYIFMLSLLLYTACKTAATAVSAAAATHKFIVAKDHDKHMLSDTINKIIQTIPP